MDLLQTLNSILRNYDGNMTCPIHVVFVSHCRECAKGRSVSKEALEKYQKSKEVEEQEGAEKMAKYLYNKEKEKPKEIKKERK